MSFGSGILWWGTRHRQGFWPRINCSQMKLPNFGSPSIHSVRFWGFLSKNFFSTTVDSWPKTLPMPSARSWNSTTKTHLVYNIENWCGLSFFLLLRIKLTCATYLQIRKQDECTKTGRCFRHQNNQLTNDR